VDLVVVVPQLPPAEPLLVAPLLRKPRKRLRKRVCFLQRYAVTGRLLIHFAEKEESDEDMGFGLFD
jgi:hypothetical protein